jgi:hypothetical protein
MTNYTEQPSYSEIEVIEATVTGVGFGIILFVVLITLLGKSLYGGGNTLR